MSYFVGSVSFLVRFFGSLQRDIVNLYFSYKIQIGKGLKKKLKA